MPIRTTTIDAPTRSDTVEHLRRRPGAQPDATRCARRRRHGERAVLLCSFQKEESVLIDELLRLDGGTTG